MNKVMLMGRLTKDPVLLQTVEGTAVTQFTIAVNRRFVKDGRQQADFINCVAWRQQAEFLCKYFKKGSLIAIVGSIQTKIWYGQDGKKNYATEVSADEIYFTGEKADKKVEDKHSEPCFDDFGFRQEDSMCVLPFDEVDGYEQ